MLLEAGADATAIDWEGLSALMLAARHDKPLVMEYLITHCHLPCHHTDALGRDVLMHAAACGAEEAVALLLQHKAEWGVQLCVHDKEGFGVVEHACMGGSKGVLQLLSDAGVPFHTDACDSAQSLTCSGNVGSSQQRYDPNNQDTSSLPSTKQELKQTSSSSELGGPKARHQPAAASCSNRPGLLYLACHKGNIDTVAWLLERGIGRGLTSCTIIKCVGVMMKTM